MEKSLILLSGGLDSTVALGTALNQGYEVVSAIFFDYGQRTTQHERGACLAVCQDYSVPLQCLTLPTIASPLTSRYLPRTEKGSDGFAQPLYVPARNLLFVAHAASIAYEMGIFTLVTGSTPSQSYPDTGRAYFDTLERTLDDSTWKHWSIFTPLIQMSKSEIVRLGTKIDAPLEKTWSCYDGTQMLPCGNCRACQKRAEAFRLAGIVDPAR